LHQINSTILFLKMIVSIIGSGNTATMLGKLLKKNNYIIKEIISRNGIAAEKLAKEFNANACTAFKQFDKNSDVYIIAVRDDAVAEVSAQVNMSEKIVVHTCGSVPMNVLAETSSNYGVLYPLQSLRKELNYSPVIPFLVNGNNNFSRESIFNLAKSIAEKVIAADDELRLQYHLSAIIVSNFTNHLFALAKDYCSNNNVDFSLLLPLIEETVIRLKNYEPVLMQTGPAIRGDETTMQKHLHLLNEFPQLKKIYEVMSESIQQYYYYDRK
jgi:predicted short-subunit dehydrogenase-like oxidoreductase (DUF2520 family)